MRLTEKPRARIPGTIGAPAQPAEIGGERQQQKQRLAHRAGEMRNRGIDGDDRVQRGDRGGRVGKILKAGADRQNIAAALQQRRILFTHFVLQADEGDAGQVE